VDEHGCMVCSEPDFSRKTFGPRTIMICDQCECEYHVQCLNASGQCDLKVRPV
jgi:hypothetical protein